MIIIRIINDFPAILFALCVMGGSVNVGEEGGVDSSYETSKFVTGSHGSDSDDTSIVTAVTPPPPPLLPGVQGGIVD